MTIARNLAVLALIAALIWSVIRITREVDSAIHHAENSLDSITADAHAIVLPAQNALAQIAAVSKVASQIEADERRQFTAQNAQFTATVARTNTLLDNANDILAEANHEILPAISAAVGDGDRSIRSLDSSLVLVQRNLAQLQQAEGELTADARDAQPALAGLRTVEDNSAQATANLAATTADIRAFVHRETAPVRGTWHVIKDFLFSVAGPAASVATSLK